MWGFDGGRKQDRRIDGRKEERKERSKEGRWRNEWRHVIGGWRRHVMGEIEEARDGEDRRGT